MTRPFITLDITLRGGFTKSSSNHNLGERTNGSHDAELARRTGRTEQKTGMGKVVHE